MKNLSSELSTHLGQEVTSTATCWKVTRRDGVVLGFTDHDADIEFEAVSYLAASGFTPTAIESSAQLSVDNLDIEGMLDASVITEADILAGKYDFAEVEVFLVNYADVSQGRMILRTGWIGEVRVQGKQFMAEMRGLTQQISTRIGSHYSPGCRADFGDASCKIDASTYTVSGTVSTGASRQVFEDSARAESAGYFASGKVSFTSGDNAGLSMEVKEFNAGAFTLVLPLPYVIDAGDAYEAVAGCDKNFTTCVAQFNNAVNFRGEPHVPGTDKLMETAATRNV